MGIFKNNFRNVEKAQKEQIYKGRINLIFESIMVICVGDDIKEPEKFNLQTFRIDNKVKFNELRNVIHGLWNFKNDIDNYNLFLIENNSMTIIEENENKQFIDSYLKTRSNLEKCQFMFINKANKFGKK